MTCSRAYIVYIYLAPFPSHVSLPAPSITLTLGGTVFCGRRNVAFDAQCQQRKGNIRRHIFV